MIACTDAALGQAVVSDGHVPSRIRQGLNGESGLNDGLCAPLFFIALAIANAEESALTAADAFRIVAEEIGYGVVGGVLAGAVGVVALRQALRHASVEASWLQLPGQHLLLLATTFTIALSVLAHGITARPLTDRYARWYAAHPRGQRAMESVDVAPLPVRWQRAPADRG